MAKLDPRNPSPLLPSLENVLHSVVTVRQRAARLEELADDAEQNLIELKGQIEHLHAPLLRNMATRPLPRKAPKRDKYLAQLAAKHGADKLELSALPRGAMSVRINDGRGLRLPRTLAILMEKLAQDSGTDGGSLVGWKSFSDVQAHLQERLQRPFKRHNLDQLVWRLRQALGRDAELNRYFVMVDSRLGFRFALRRPLLK